METKELYTVKDLCEFYSISRQAISRWIKCGKLKVMRTPSGGIRISRREFERLQVERFESE